MSVPEQTTTKTPEPIGAADTAAAIERGAVVRWWQTTAFLRVAGPDAPTLLDGLCTQAVERIERGTGVPGLFLDAKAKIIAPALLHRIADEAWTEPRTAAEVDAAPVLLLETLPDLVEPLRSHLSKYRLRAKATIEPVERSTIALLGADLPAPPDVATGAWSSVRDQAYPTLAWIGPADAVAPLVAELATHAPLADAGAFEAVRIEAGVAGLHDLLPGRMPAEVGGMASAVALDAGCYLGQEPVARLHYRGHANRTLRRVTAQELVAPAAPPTDADGKPDLDAAFALRRPEDAEDARPVGRLTTWATHPEGHTVGLAVLRRELAAGDTVVLAGTRADFTIVDAPEGE